MGWSRGVRCTSLLRRVVSVEDDIEVFGRKILKGLGDCVLFGWRTELRYKQVHAEWRSEELGSGTRSKMSQRTMATRLE